MTEKEIHKFGEIQYLKGRLDELYKALPTISNIGRKRKLDQRIEKYFLKLYDVDKVSHHIYTIELKNRERSKEKSKSQIKKLLNSIIDSNTVDGDILGKIREQIEKYG